MNEEKRTYLIPATAKLFKQKKEYFTCEVNDKTKIEFRPSVDEDKEEVDGVLYSMGRDLIGCYKIESRGIRVFHFMLGQEMETFVKWGKIFIETER